LISDEPFEIRITSARYTDKGYITVYVGDVVNCSANGYPLPVVLWIETSNHGAPDVLDDVSGTGWGLHTFSKLGTEEWNCSASNVYPYKVQKTMNFTFHGWLKT